MENTTQDTTQEAPAPETAITAPSKAVRERAENKRLKAYHKRYHMTRPEIAEIVGVSVSRVDSWLYPPENRHYRAMPERLLRLFEFELGKRFPRFQSVTIRQMHK